MRNIILASQSPRRRELLTQIGLHYEVCPSTVEEVIDGENPVEIVKSLSLQKADDVAQRKMREGMQEPFLVIGADTIVVYENKILGKPKHTADAKAMLTMLQGNTHSVYTGVTLIFAECGQWKCKSFAEETQVSMCAMSSEEIDWYISTNEPMDKAGAYGIQGYCARFIEKIHGDYNNVVGLPVGRIYQEIKAFAGSCML